VNYSLGSEEVEIIGFFSTEHQAVFTHHDTYVHLHLMTKDESKMGHLDEVVFDEMKLYLPKG
jgi:acetolactate decarboxylase